MPNHPHWESPRDIQRRDWEDEVSDFVRNADRQREELENKRILEA